MSYTVAGYGPGGKSITNLYTDKNFDSAKKTWANVASDDAYTCGAFYDGNNTILGRKANEPCNDLIRKKLGMKAPSAWDKAMDYIKGQSAGSGGGAPMVVQSGSSSIVPYVAVGAAVLGAAYFFLLRK